MKRVDLALGMFDVGFNCAQSIAASFGPGYGLDRDVALKMAAPLGGGLSRTNGLCGAAAGAILILGFIHGPIDAEDEAGMDRIRHLTKEFLGRFALMEGSTQCTDILGVDLSQPGVVERVETEELSSQKCPSVVRHAGEILVEMLKDPSLIAAT